MSLADILAKKKAEAALPKPTVEFYVALYELAPRDLYLNYFEGFRWLVYWLGLPYKTTATGVIPPLLRSYELQEMAKYLEVDPYYLYLLALRNARMPEKFS